MIEDLINNIDSIILAFVQGAFGSLTPTVQLLWRLMFIIFIAVFGYKVIISGRFAATDLIVNTLKIIILLLIARHCYQRYDLMRAMAMKARNATSLFSYLTVSLLFSLICPKRCSMRLRSL